MGKRRNTFVVSDDSGDERPAKVSKKVKKASSSGGGGPGPDVDSEGNPFWELSNKRRVVISGFKGNMYVNIREFYEDASGEMKPGKKGIMLSIDQYKALADFMPAINDELRKKGVDVDEKEADSDESDEKTAKKSTTKKKSKDKSVSKKANIEATSDEDESGG